MSKSFQKSISVTRLRVNPNNVRYEGAAKDQNDAIRRIIVDQGRKFVALCKHITKNGLEPGRSVYVHPIAGTKDYVLLDGNRRLSAIKVLSSAELQKEFKDLLPKNFHSVTSEFMASGFIAQVECSVFNVEEDAREWIAINHGFAAEGITTQDWNSDVRGKVMASYKKTKRQRDGLVLDYLRETGLTDINLKDRLSSGQTNNTALRRFLSDDTLARLGINFSNGVLNFDASPNEVVKTLIRVVTDFISKKIKTQNVWDEKARKEYMDNLENEGMMPDLSIVVETTTDEPDSIDTEHLSSDALSANETVTNPDVVMSTQGSANTTNSSTESSQSDANGSVTDESNSTTNLNEVQPSFTKPKPIVRGRDYVFSKTLTISNKNARIVDIYNELTRIKVTENPNAVAFLLRAFVEMLVKEYDRKHKVKNVGKNDSLREALDRAVEHYRGRYGKGDENDFRGIKEACEERNLNSIFAIESFQQLVHRERLKPIPTEVIARWDNIEPAIIHLLAKT